MFGTKEQSESANQAASTENAKTFGRFRRRSQQPPQKFEERNESEGVGRRAFSSSREKTPAVNNSNGSFFGGDKRQKKVVYREFSESPTQVLETVIEDIPEPASERDVVIKILVSELFLVEMRLRIE